MAVEIRDEGTALIQRCVFTNCKSQALSLYAGGKKLEVVECEFQACGCFPDKSSILADSGVLVIKNSKLVKNETNAIVLQRNRNVNATPILMLYDSIISENTRGCYIFDGSAILSGNTIENNAGAGLHIHEIAKGKKVILQNNKFRANNTPPCDFQTYVDLHHDIVIDASNSFSTPPSFWPVEVRDNIIARCRSPSV
jgi:hypothetical protein